MSGTVLDQAENVGGVVSAARLRDSFKRRQANAPDEETRAALGDAIGTLEVRFPELEEIPAGGAERFAQERGHGKGARSPSHEGRRRPGAKRPDAEALERAAGDVSGKPGKLPSAGGGGGSTPRSQSPRASSLPGMRTAASRRVDRQARRIARRTERAYRQTGIPGAGATTTEVVMGALGATVGLSATYLLLSSAEQPGTGGHALPQMLHAITQFIDRFIAPRDILSGNDPAVGHVTVHQAGTPASADKRIPIKPGNVATAAARLKAAGEHPGNRADARPSSR
jgi:hypothetical protein